MATNVAGDLYGKSFWIRSERCSKTAYNADMKDSAVSGVPII